MGIKKVMKTFLRFAAALFVVGTMAFIPLSAQAQTAAAKPTLLVAVRSIEPFVFKSADGNFSGFSIDLLDGIADEANFEVSYFEVDSVGAQLDAVREGRADLAIGSISITSAREETVDFSSSMFESGIQGMVSSSSNTLDLRSLLATVISPVLLIVFAMMILGTVLTGVIVWAWERRHGNEHFTNSGSRGIFDGIWWATVTLFTIGYGDKVPSRFLSRIVTMMWMFVGVLMVATITAEFTSSLTVERLEGQISSVSDLVDDDVVTYPGTTSWDYLIRNGIRPRPVDSNEEAYQQVRSGEADAFVYDAPVIQWLVANRAGVTVAGPVIQPENFGIVTAQGSPLTEQVDRALLGLREDGTYERLKKSYFG